MIKFMDLFKKRFKFKINYKIQIQINFNKEEIIFKEEIK
jgi:hypothetical protein